MVVLFSPLDSLLLVVLLLVQQWLQCNPDGGKCGAILPGILMKMGISVSGEQYSQRKLQLTDTLCQERSPLIPVAVKEVLGVALVASVVECNGWC